MTNEEKILEVLDKLVGRMDKLEGRFDKLEGRFTTLEGRFTTLEGRFDTQESNMNMMMITYERVKDSQLRMEIELEKRTDALKARMEVVESSQLLVENVLKPKIEIALDGHIDIKHHEKKQDARIDKVEIKVERHDADITRLKHAVG